MRQLNPLKEKISPTAGLIQRRHKPFFYIAAFVVGPGLIAVLVIGLVKGPGFQVNNTGSVSAAHVYGQLNFVSNFSNRGESPSPTRLAQPGGVALEKNGGLYIADTGNNRVLHYQPGSSEPDRVYGQADFSSRLKVVLAITNPTNLYIPQTIAVDPIGGVYIADSANNRVLHYSGTNTLPDRVYGQPNFTTNTANTGGVSATSLSIPEGVAAEAVSEGGLYIADTDNNRVLHYSGTSTIADRVYGQPDFRTTIANNRDLISTVSTLWLPTAVALDSVDGVGLYVADSENNRVLHFTATSTVPDRIYGQNDLPLKAARSGGGARGPAGLDHPRGVAPDLDPAGGLYIADTANNRVLHYSGTSIVADRVYGQPDFASKNPNSSSSVSSTSLYSPQGLAVADSGANIYVADTNNNRVLVYKCVQANRST